MNLKHLNAQQKKAVTWGDSPLMVIAGAGSGKTRVLTYRVAHLLKRGCLPSKMMVTTFTNKAAEEMRERLEPLIGETKADRLKIGTFHSLSYRILRDLLESSGKYEIPRLMMGGGRWMTMVKIVNNYSYGDKRFPQNRFATKDIKGILNKISYWKNEGLRVQDIEKVVNEEKIPLYENGGPKGNNPNWGFTAYGTYLQAYKDYEKEMKEQGKIDFDDMLFKCYWELEKPKNKKFLDRLRKKTHHILVDEAQDLNKIQFLLVKIIAGDNQRITMVGDDYQVLYGFRGARVTEIIEFGKFYNAEIVRLEQNYRSNKKIVEYGNRLIKHNTTQIWKDLFTDNEEGPNANVMMSETDEFEAQNVMAKIENMIMEGYELNDIAILYRTNAQSRAIVDEFIMNHIPHKVYSNEGFYDRKEMKDMLAYLKICYSPFEADPEDFKRIINRPSRFLGKKFIDDIEDLMFEKEYDNFWQALQHYYEVHLGPVQLRNAKKFVDQLNMISKRIETTELTTREIFELILDETKYLEWMNKELESADEEPDNDTKMNLDSLLVGASRFRNPQDFLLFVESMEFEKNEEEDAVHCMTVHKSKGMEFPVVFIIGMSSPTMPHYKADDIEEERRIAYVAVTRAKEELYLSTISGKVGRMKAKPSQFLDEMGVLIPSRFTGVTYVEGHQENFFRQLSTALGDEENKKPKLTKYDKNGKVISIDVYDPNLPDMIDQHIDATIGEKHFEVDDDGNFSTIEPEEMGEQSDFVRR